MSQQPFELVIFDCDGVLVDSERIANEVFRDILNEECGFNLELTDMFNTFVGHSSAQCMEIIRQMLGQDAPWGLEHRYKTEITRALERSVTAVSGIEAVLQELESPFCVASSGSYEKMETTLGKTGLQGYFRDNVFSTSDVPRGKPHPDIYLHACRKMGVEHPDQCLVIEDSPLGVTGGVAAGMTVFGYAEHMSEKRLREAGAHLVFDTMEKLLSNIAHYK